MPRHITKMNDFTNVVAGGKATVDLGVRDRYHQIYLKVGQQAGNSRADIIAAIGSIKLKINGKDQWDITAAQMFALNDQYNLPDHTGFIPLYFSNPRGRTFADEIFTAWDMTGQTTFQAEVEIKAGVVNPTIEAYARTVPGDPAIGLGMIRKISQVRIPNNQIGADAITLDSLPLHGGVKALHLFETAANDVTEVDIKLAKKTIFEADRSVIDMLSGEDGYKAVAGVASVRFDATGKQDDAMPLINTLDGRQHELRIDIGMANANPLTMVREYIGPAN